MILEIAANSVASALAAQEGGAGRVELCAALELGGLTPSHAQIALARERLHIPLYVLIRPRAGDFLYSELECETMQRDIETCVALGCDGVVLGVLDAEGRVDAARCRALIAAAGKLGVTFHRAFDLSRDPAQALEDIVALGCERILTSGTQASAPDGAALIRELVVQAAGRLAVMPGAGVNAQNIAAWPPPPARTSSMPPPNASCPRACSIGDRCSATWRRRAAQRCRSRYARWSPHWRRWRKARPGPERVSVKPPPQGISFPPQRHSPMAGIAVAAAKGRTDGGLRC